MFTERYIRCIVVDFFSHEMVKIYGLKALSYYIFNLIWLKFKIYWATLSRSLLNEVICIIGCHARKIAKSLKSRRRRKLISARFFYIFLQPNILLEEIKRSFQWSGLDLSNINQERKSVFYQLIVQKTV